MAHYIHFIVLGICIIGILIFQLKICKQTLGKLDLFRTIFPDKADDEFGIVKNSEKGTCIANKGLFDAITARDLECQALEEERSELHSQLLEELAQLTDIEDGATNGYLQELSHNIENVEYKIQKRNDEIQQLKDNLFSSVVSTNPLGETIISAINSYLLKNRNSSADFHLIKDIVDRNTDAAEDEINTQIPVPLYCGLAGTMLGVIIGVGALCISKGLDELLKGADSGADGIEALIGGVAVAMISSLVGVVLTTFCSLKAKDAKKETERRKHDFLSWIQSELLPVLSSDAMSAISKMTENLADFNSTFAQNAKELKGTLSLVAQTSQDQARLFETLENLKIQKVATANIEVYDKLKNCTDEIGYIAECLKASRRYLEKVEELSTKLDDADSRVRMIEEMARFFKEERTNLDSIKAVIAQSMGTADENLHKASEELKASVSDEYKALTQHFIKERENFAKVADEQQGALEKRMSELNQVISELKNLSAVKSSMEKLVDVTKSQNDRIDKLAQTISALAAIKTTGNVPLLPLVPKWAKITAIACAGVVVLSCLLLAIMSFIR